MFFCVAVKGQLHADFKADVVAGCAPVLVKFTDLSTGNPASWEWDLGNGNKSFQQNPGTLYFNPGTYSVKLIIKNATGGIDSVIKSNFIVISNDPDVNFSVNATAGCVPFAVKFTDNSNAGFGNIVKWEWDFGDGSTSLLQSPSHTYNVDGDITVILKVTNSGGCAKVARKPLLLHINPSPSAGFTTGSSVSCNPPADVNFINNSTGSVVSSWSFGDGSVSSDINPSHTYTRAGSYQVQLVVSNQSGCTDTLTKPVVIGSVTPDFRRPDTVCQGAQVNFVNTSSPATASSFWTFGDGTSSADINPVKTYSSPGNFQVSLINNFGACTDSVKKNIYVIPNPVADFSFVTPSSSCSLPVNVSFSTALPAAAYLWNFGDGSTSATANPTHSYAAYGSYTVSLTITSANGCTVTETKANVISIVPPHINSLDTLPFFGCVPHEQKFSANITSPEPVTAYLWDFGDGSSSALATPSHNYNTEGTFNVSLQITTSGGCHDTLVFPAAIIVGTKPSANFTASPTVACANQLIKFTDNSSGSVNNYFWEFGDNNSSTEANPSHHYTDTGFFTVKLRVGSYYCYDTIVFSNYVYIKPPVARFDVLYNCDTPYARRFINRSVAAETLTWNFGDGASSDQPYPVYTYASPGTYNVNLHVTNGDCFDDLPFTVKIIDEHPDFTISNDVTCKNTTSVFTATNINAANISTYSWNFGDNSPGIAGTISSASYKYVQSGSYIPSLTITDVLGCKRSIERSLAIAINGPTAAFTNPEGACINSPVSFTNQSQPFGGFEITNWIIKYGDGMSDTAVTAPSFVHNYTAAGKYNVVWIVTDSYGCTDSILRREAVTITDPAASFVIKDPVKCSNAPVTLINTSQGLGLSYNWSFGDGSSSAVANPTHNYPAYGAYSVALTVTDKYGCTGSFTAPDSILITNAKANFSASDSVITCPPAQINFLNTSLYSTSVMWNFDDGGTSNIQAPSHYFSALRSYNVKLVAFGYGSCADSIVKKIVVTGPSGSFTYSPLTKCAPAQINFTASVVNSQKLVWDFGDGSTNSTTATSVSYVYTELGKFLPKLLLIDSAVNCTISLNGTDTISVAGATAYIKTHPLLFCDSAAVQFFDSSVIKTDLVSSYLWNFGDGTRSALQNPFHNFRASGIFPVTLVVTTVSGCVDSAQTNIINVQKSPVLQVTGAAEACVNQPVTFSASAVQPGTSVLVWNWDFDNDSTSALQKPPVQTYAVAGNYSIKTWVTNSNGCTDTALRTLTVYPLPVVYAGPDTTICRGRSLVLVPSGAQTYQWANNSTLSCTTCSNPTASPLVSPVSYIVTGKSTAGCQAIDTINIKVVQPANVSVSAGDTICAGNSVNLSATGAELYNWSPPAALNNARIANPVARPATTTVYTVIGSDSSDCFADTATVTLTVYPIPVFNIIQNNILISVGNSISLATSGSADISRWSWTPSAGLSCSNCPMPVASPAVNTTYKAVVSNNGGCTAQDMVTVRVFCQEGDVFIPNTFSPNNDGSNDVFFPRGKGIAAVKKMQVFNRWGNLVFQRTNFGANDAQYGWNGTYNGQTLNADVYTYQMEIVCLNNEVFTYKGNVTLLR